MTDKPRWYGQLQWSQPHLVGALIASPARAAIPKGAGLYAFTKDRPPLSRLNCLYIVYSDEELIPDAMLY